MRPCLLVDILWEQFAEEAACLDVPATAGPLWRTGAQLGTAFDAPDPRHATSLHWRAAMARDTGDLPKAEALYNETIAAWKRVPEWVSQMGIEFTARSASMHIRLEMKRTEELRNLKRSINARLAEGGLAAALNNLGELLHATGGAGDAERLYREAREMRAKSLSHREAGVAVICDNLADLLEATGRSVDAEEPRQRAREINEEPHHADIESFRRERSRTMTDLRKLIAAVYLAPPCRRFGT